jgi:hypothetical protein
MTMVVETGTGIANSNSYVSTTDFETYCDDHGYTIPSGDEESALVRATLALDAAYRANYPGYRTLGRMQGLDWPRTAAYDYEGYVIDTLTVPREIIWSTCEMGLREITTPGIMQPDLKRGGFIRSMRAGSVEIVYGGSSNRTIFTIVDGIMSSLLGSVSSASISGTAVRG